jgi:hypothetical protein
MTLGLLLLESTDEASGWEEILPRPGRPAGEGAPYHPGGDRGRSAQTPRPPLPPPLGLAQFCRLHADSRVVRRRGGRLVGALRSRPDARERRGQGLVRTGVWALGGT